MSRLTDAAPSCVVIDGANIPIMTGHRRALLTIEALESPELLEHEKIEVVLYNLFNIDIDEGDPYPDNWPEYIKQAYWFLSCGKEQTKENQHPVTYDFGQDADLIFEAFLIRKIDLGKEELHWWTFCGHFSELPKSTFTAFIELRYKKAVGKMTEVDRKQWALIGDDILSLKKSTQSFDNYAQTLENEGW